MMKEQIDKEIRSLQDKKKKLKERDKEIAEQKADLTTQVKNMELYASENNFNIFYEKKRRELKNLQQLNEFVKPAPYFVYFMFKDTIHVDDYGSIKETLFKFPSMTRVSISNRKMDSITLTILLIMMRAFLLRLLSFMFKLLSLLLLPVGCLESSASNLPVRGRCELED